MFKKIGRKLSKMLRDNIGEVAVEHSLNDPMGALRYSIKLRNPAEKGDDFAFVSYEIASSFPKLNTRPFNFLIDWQVWFLIENREKKRYKAYIKIKFISGDYGEEAGKSHYSGDFEWRLNGLTGIVAPGLGIPETIRERAKQRKPIKIRILCEIKDENDNLVEKKLPVEYIYDYKKNTWYLEP